MSVPACTTTWYTSGSSAPAILAARNDSAMAARPSARSEDVRTAGAQADQVVQVSAAAVDPVLDVVQVDPAGLAPREPAPAVIPLPRRATDRRAGTAPPAAQGQHGAGVPVGHPRQRGGAGDHLRGGHADGRAVLHVAPGRIRRITRNPHPGRRFRGNAGRGRRLGEHAGAGVDHDLVHLRVIGPGHLPGQERLGHRDQPVSQI